MTSVEVLSKEPGGSTLAAPPAGGAEVPVWVWYLIVAVGAGLRFIGLGRAMLTFDETFTAEAARLSPARLVSFLRVNDAHPPLDYLMRHPFAAAGMSEFWLRLPSATLSTAALVVAVLWWRRFGRAGLLGAAMLAVGPFSITYARDARMYAGLELVGISVAAMAHLWLRQRPRRTPPIMLWALGIACLAGLLLQSGALFLVPALLLVPGLARDREAWRWRLTIGAALAVWAIVWAPSFLVQLRHGHSTWIPFTTPSYLVSVLNEMVDSYRVLGILVIGLVTLGALALPGRELRRVWLIVGLLPIAVGAVGGVWVHLLIPRTFAFAAWVPMLPLGFLADWVLRRSTVVGLGVLVMIGVLLLPSTADAVTNNGASQAPAFRYVRAVARPGDAVVATPTFLEPMVDWYFGVRWFRGGVVVERPDLPASGVRVTGSAATGRTWVVLSRSYDIHTSAAECAPRRRFGDFIVVCLGS